MIFPLKWLARPVNVSVCVLILCSLLASCGHPQSNSSHEKTSGSQVAGPAAIPTVADEVVYKLYTSPDFSIQYPTNWQVTTSNTNAAFTDPTGNYNLTIGFTPNPNALASPDQLADGGASGAQNSLTDERVIAMPRTALISQQPWSQRAVTGTSALGPGNSIEAVVLANNHPAKTASTKGYVIVCVTAQERFAQAQRLYFLPMLQSFTFTR